MDSEKSKFILLRRPYIYYSAGILLAILFTAQCAAMIPLYQLALFPFDLEDPNRWFWHAVINSWYYINCGFLYIFSTTFALSVMKRFIQWKSWMKVCLFLLLFAFCFCFCFDYLFVLFVLFCLFCLFVCLFVCLFLFVCFCLFCFVLFVCLVLVCLVFSSLV